MALFGKKDDKLFELFNETARVVVMSGDVLCKLVVDYTDLDKKLADLTEMEHEGDRIMEQLVEKLNSSFVLPFDREDAFQLVQKLGATFDYITGIIDRMILYKAGEPTQPVHDMIDLLYQTLKEQEHGFNLLDKLDKNKKELLQCTENIKSLEKQMDTLYRKSVAELFENEKDPIRIIKWKEVYENIEMASDYIEEVGKLLSNICIKYS